MKTIPYRDHKGYIIRPKDRPVFDESRSKFSGGYSIAVLIYCPETDGLKHIGECEKCEFFRSHAKFKGVKCASTSQNEPPYYYNKNQPQKRLLKWKQQIKTNRPFKS